eukprot:7284482-Prymnesium_polylepis.1
MHELGLSSKSLYYSNILNLSRTALRHTEIAGPPPVAGRNQTRKAGRAQVTHRVTGVSARGH